MAPESSNLPKGFNWKPRHMRETEKFWILQNEFRNLRRISSQRNHCKLNTKNPIREIIFYSLENSDRTG